MLIAEVIAETEPQIHVYSALWVINNAIITRSLCVIHSSKESSTTFRQSSKITEIKKSAVEQMHVSDYNDNSTNLHFAVVCIIIKT